MTAPVRPTKKQRQLLDFIEQFIDKHGYSPSYREIMNGCDYNSVATVALHVNNLIQRGHLRKRDHSARSLEVVRAADAPTSKANGAHEAWLLSIVESYISGGASQQDDSGSDGRHAANSGVLIEALRLLGMPEQADELLAKLFSSQETPAAAEKAL